MKLYELAHSRTGDKGNISNVSLIAYEDALFNAVHYFFKILHGSVLPVPLYTLQINISSISEKPLQA